MARRKSKRRSKLKLKPESESTFGTSIAAGIAGTVEDDLKAINDYINRTDTSGILKLRANGLKSDWNNWYRSLGWFDFYVEGEETLNNARRRRYEFNNALGTPEQKPPVAAKIDNGGYVVDQHNPDNYGQRTLTKDDAPDPPLIPTKYKWGIGIGVGVLGTLWLSRQVVNLAKDAKSVLMPF